MNYSKDDKLVFVIMTESEYNLQEMIEPYKLIDKELIVIIDRSLTKTEKEYLIGIIKERFEHNLTSLIWKECVRDTKVAYMINSLIMKRYLLQLRKCNEMGVKIICNDYEALDNEIYTVLGEWW